jgi:hypothetical protein
MPNQVQIEIEIQWFVMAGLVPAIHVFLARRA